MPTEPRDTERELDRILDGVVASILEASEEELDEDLRAAGEDPDEAVERLRAKLGKTMEHHGASRRADARRRMQQYLLLQSIHPYELPETAKERMRLLGAAIHRQPELEEKLAVELRDLESLKDEEVESYLRQLAESGLLEGLSEDGE